MSARKNKCFIFLLFSLQENDNWWICCPQETFSQNVKCACSTQHYSGSGQSLWSSTRTRGGCSATTCSWHPGRFCTSLYRWVNWTQHFEWFSAPTSGIRDWLPVSNQGSWDLFQSSTCKTNSIHSKNMKPWALVTIVFRFRELHIKIYLMASKA